MRIWLRVKALFRRRRLKRELQEELAFHQAMMREKLMRSGAEPTEVQISVRRQFGNEDRWRERLSELWQFRWLENLMRDVNFGARQLRKSPGFTAVALLTLMLGIGANAAVFSLINGLMLRPLPVPHAEELAILRVKPGKYGYAFCTPLFRGLEKRTDIFRNVFAFNWHIFQVRNGSRNEAHGGELVSGQFFQALGVAPQLGRYLTPEDKPGRTDLAVVISDDFWKTWFNQAPDVIGRKLLMDNVWFTVVGVMPQSFIGVETTARPQMYVPLATEPLVDVPFNFLDSGYRNWWLRAGVRMQPGMSIEQANAALRSISSPIIKDAIPDPNRRFGDVTRDAMYIAAMTGTAGYSLLREQFRSPLVVVMVLCGTVLLLACLNLASLLMARAAAREREIATRLAIGATRRRVIQQLLVESMLLALLGTVAGFVAAPFVSHALAALMTNSQPQSAINTSMDIRILLFGAAVTFLCALIIGFVPAVQVSSGSLQEQMKQGSQSVRAGRRHRVLTHVLLASEVALALTLVVGAGLIGTSVLRVYQDGFGFDPHGVLIADLNMDKQPLKGEPLRLFYRDFAGELAHIRGVKSASYTGIIPLSGNSGWDDWNANGKKETLYESLIAPNYFETMRIPLFSGRDFAWTDTASTDPKAILNQAAAKFFFPNGNAVGQIIRDSDGKDAKSYEVIAVVGNTKYDGLRDAPPPMVYRAITQNRLDKPSYTAMLRVEGKPGPIVDAVRDLASRLAPDIPAPIMLTMDRQIDEAINSMRMMAMLSIFFAVCALLVTGIGLYGTLAYSTSRRTSEIGIRMALGAQRGQVAMLVFRENAVVALTGSVAGLVIALLASRALVALLYNTSTRDVPVLVVSALLLAVTASVASLLPALQAARVEPMTAIRHE